MKKFFESCTFFIGLICVAVLIAQQNVEGFEDAFVLSGSRLWRIDTWIMHMFMHGGWTHLIFNMIGVLSIGYSIEQLMGRWKYLALYLLSGLAGSILQMAYYYFTIPPNISYALVGASGALCGIIGALAYYRPNAQLLLFFIIPIKTIHLYWVFMVIGFVFTVMNYFEDGHELIAHLAHSGGLIAGFILAKLICEKIVFYVVGTNYQKEEYEGYVYSVDTVIDFLMEHPFAFRWEWVEGRQLNEQEDLRIKKMTYGIGEVMKKSLEELKEMEDKINKIKGTDNSPSE